VEYGEGTFHIAIVHSRFLSPTNPKQKKQTREWLPLRFPIATGQRKRPPEEDLHERWTEFDARFSRCYGSLRFVARRILGSGEEIEDVIENC